MTTIFNPLNEDYVNTFDLNGDGVPIQYSVPAQGFAEFEDEALIEHCKQHLAKKIVFTRGIKTNFDDEYHNARKEITV